MAQSDTATKPDTDPSAAATAVGGENGSGNGTNWEGRYKGEQRESVKLRAKISQLEATANGMAGLQRTVDLIADRVGGLEDSQASLHDRVEIGGDDTDDTDDTDGLDGSARPQGGAHAAALRKRREDEVRASHAGLLQRSYDNIEETLTDLRAIGIGGYATDPDVNRAQSLFKQAQNDRTLGHLAAEAASIVRSVATRMKAEHAAAQATASAAASPAPDETKNGDGSDGDADDGKSDDAPSARKVLKQTGVTKGQGAGGSPPAANIDEMPAVEMFSAGHRGETIPGRGTA